MSQINTLNANAPTSDTQVGNSIQNLDLDVFLDLMLAELQNQDPLDPMDNDQMLNTISQIREISANDKLSGTLDSVLLGQNVSTAAGLIGTKVEGLTDDGRRVIGDVQNVAINDGEPLLDLAVNASASAGESDGEIAEGSYTYSVVWDAGENTFGVQIPVSTDDLGDDFAGSIRLENIPETDGVTKRVYRTANPGGEPRLLGPLPDNATTFTDQRATSSLGTDTFDPNTQFVSFANSVKVRLSNISSVESVQR